MQKIDAGIVADVLAYCEAHTDNDEAQVLYWIAEHIGAAIKRDHPRFNLGEWQARSNPIRVAELRAAARARMRPNAT
jgi:hypothetical protein